MQELLNSLLTQRQALLSSGDILRDCWIAASKPAGTASQGASPHYQLRSRLPQFSGKRSRYLRAEDVPHVEAAIGRGRELARLDREIAQTVKAIDKTATAAAKLGIPLDRMMK